MRSHNKIIILLCLLILVSSCNSVSTENVKNTDDSQLTTEPTQSLSNNLNQENVLQNTPNSKELQPENVNIDVKISGVSNIEKKVLPAEVLQYKDDIPIMLHPRCIAIDFKGDYTKDYHPKEDEEFWFPARLMICPVADFPKAVTEAPDWAKSFENEVSEINKILLTKPTKIKTNFPTFLYLGWGSPQFVVNLDYVSFKNGEGFFVMTHYAMENMVIINKNIEYIFQGLTNDKKYYIWGIFPVASSHLPNESKSIISTMYGKKYDGYLMSVKKKLEDRTSFTPKLEEIEETVKSLEIKQP